MDRLTSMAVFVKVTDLGSFTAAADTLGMSAQMVAKHVVFLEDRLGAVLLNRTTRRQNLTDVGRAFYERCKLLLAEAEAVESLARDMQSHPSGVLRVNAPVTFGAFTLAAVVTRYLARHPEVEIDLTLNDRIIDPVEDGFDIVVRVGELTDSELVAHPLAPYRLIACAAPAYLQRRGMPRTPADLAAHDCLAHVHAASTLTCRWQFSRRGQTEEVPARGRIRSNDWKALLHAALEGYGVALGPESILAAEIAAGRLVHVLPDYEGPARPMHVLYPAARRPTAKVRSFVEVLLAECGPQAGRIEPAGGDGESNGNNVLNPTFVG